MATKKKTVKPGDVLFNVEENQVGLVLGYSQLLYAVDLGRGRFFLIPKTAVLGGAVTKVGTL